MSVSTQTNSTHKHLLGPRCQISYFGIFRPAPYSEILGTMATVDGLYQILEIPEPVSRSRHLLGSVIPTNSFTAPLTRYAPYFDSPRWETEQGKKEKESLDNNLNSLWKASNEKKIDSVPLSNLLSARSTSDSNDASVKVTEALKAYFNKTGKKNFKIENGKTEQYNIDNAGSALEERLCLCKPWLDEVQRLYSKDNRKTKDSTYLFATGIWVCQDIEISWDEDATSKRGLEGKLPMKEIVSATATSLGFPIKADGAKAVDLSIKYDQSREQPIRARVTLDAPTIFAVRYHYLELNLEIREQKPPSRPWSSWLSKLKIKRTNSGLTEVPRPIIKSLSLGQPLRGGNQAIGSYGGVPGGPDGPDGLLYWLDPEYVSPEDFVVDENAAHNVDGAPNGVAH